MQRATANVIYSVAGANSTTVPGKAQGKGGKGGDSHSEQAVWKGASGPILNQLKLGHSVSVTFEVDTHICDLCQRWFELAVYQELLAAATTAGTQVALAVTVNGHRVPIEGENTIWPPEVGEVQTYDRLEPMEKSMRLLREGRDEDAVISPLNDSHAQDQIETLDGLLRGDLQHFGLTLPAIKTTMQAAIAEVVPLAQSRFPGPNGPNVLNLLNGLTLSEMLRSGSLWIPRAPEMDPQGVASWLLQLQRRLETFYSDTVDTKFQEARRNDYH